MFLSFFFLYFQKVFQSGHFQSPSHTCLLRHFEYFPNSCGLLTVFWLLVARAHSHLLTEIRLGVVNQSGSDVAVSHLDEKVRIIPILRDVIGLNRVP